MNREMNNKSMSEYTALNKKYLFVEIPEKANIPLIGTFEGGFLQYLCFEEPNKDTAVQLPLGSWVVLGTADELQWDSQCELMGKYKNDYDDSGMGKDGIEVDFTHYEEQAADWGKFKNEHELANKLILKKVI